MPLQFKIISVGWDCSGVLEQTLRSIENQKYPHWQAHIVDDASPGIEQADLIRNWCSSRGDKWGFTIHSEGRGAVRNQYEGIRAMNPNDEDVIVFLDLDGDQLANDHVLERLVYHYRGNTLMTYGNYRPVPDLEPDVPSPVSPYPPEVVKNNMYRQSTLMQGTRYNHLRTVKWKVLKAIPDSYFHFDDGSWIVTPADLIVMMGALELAGGRYKCIEETMVLYNAVQPHPDNMHHPGENVRGSNYTFSLQPLQRLP